MRRSIILAFAAVALASCAFGGCASTPHNPPAAAAAEPAVDVMNPLCIVLVGENATDETVTYKGKRYHVCCSDCAASFNKNPEKYVKAFEANPAAYGIK